MGLPTIFMVKTLSFYNAFFPPLLLLVLLVVSVVVVLEGEAVVG